MSDSNFTQVARVTETTWGTTPGSPVATKVRVTQESFKFAVNYIRSEEIRQDRLTPDTIQTGARANGGFGMELSYGAFDEEIESLFFSTWQKIAEITNSAADTEITAVTDSSDTFTVAAGGSAFKAGHLVRTSGFTNSANNGLFKVSSSTGTTVVVAGTPTLTDEAAPPQGAKIKAVGFEGASGDITATASGLGSTSLNFTTLGLTVGQWIKIGGGSAGNMFATALLNDWARITAIAATALTLDNKPSGWTTDNGASKTIRVWFGDYIRPGSTRKSFTYEKVVTSMTTPLYRRYRGMIANSMNLTIEASQIVTGSFDFLGKDEVTSTSSMDASPDEAPQNDIMNAVTDVGRIAENGSVISAANPIKRQTLTISNNLREQMAIGTLGLIGVGVGDFDVTGEIQTYFGDNTLYDKYVNGTATSFNTRIVQDNKAVVFTIPRCKFEDADAASGGRNQDVMCTLQYRALRDNDLTLTSFQMDRFSEYA